MKDFPNVLLLIPHLGRPGGVANHFRALHLGENSSVSYFYVNTTKDQGIFASTARLFKLYIKYIWILSFTDVDLIHVNPSLNSRSFYRDSIFMLIARILRKRYLVFFHGWEVHYQHKIMASKFRFTLFKHSFAQATSFIVLGQIFKTRLRTMGVKDANRILISATVAEDVGLDSDKIRQKIRCFPSNLNLLFISRILEEKGVYITLDIFRMLKEKFPLMPMTLTIAGDGPDLNEVKAFVRANKIRNVDFCGYVRGIAKSDVLTNAHFLLFPTKIDEGMPLCVLEGLLFGMPVISRNSGAIPDIISDNRGFLTDSMDAHEFVPYIEKLIHNPTLYQNISIKNHLYAVDKFTPKSIRQSLLTIYKSVS